MDIQNPLFAIAAIAIAIASSGILSKYMPEVRDDGGRFESIDGLRGFLAISVFIHHAVIWYFYLRTGQWHAPSSNFFNHLGQTSVALFFMTTGFLFFSKIISHKDKQINYTKILVSRVLRLLPLYLFTIFSLVLIVFLKTDMVLNESIAQLSINLLRWFAFTIAGSPPINGYSETKRILAGVTWSLPYEWFFYLSLPCLGILVRAKTSVATLLVSGVLAAFIFHLGLAGIHILSFAGGVIAALAVRNAKFLNLCRSNTSPILVAAPIILLVWFSHTGFGFWQTAVITIPFSLIAGGATFHGILTSRSAKLLGEVSYSIYLLHGILLFIVFTFAIPKGEGIRMTALAHWGTIILITPFLILASLFTYKYIELPAMRKVVISTQHVENILRFIRSRLTR